MDEKQTPSCQKFRTFPLFIGTPLGSEPRRFPNPVRRSSGWQAYRWPLSPTILAQRPSPAQLMQTALSTAPTPPGGSSAESPFCPNSSLPLGPAASTGHQPLVPERMHTRLESLHPSLKVAALCLRKITSLGIRQLNPNAVRSLGLSFPTCKIEMTGDPWQSCTKSHHLALSSAGPVHGVSLPGDCKLLRGLAG